MSKVLKNMQSVLLILTLGVHYVNISLNKGKAHDSKNGKFT